MIQVQERVSSSTKMLSPTLAGYWSSSLKYIHKFKQQHPGNRPAIDNDRVYLNTGNITFSEEGKL